MNQIQVVGTHNSYHREVSLSERAWHSRLLGGAENYYYSHSALDIQAEHQGVRSFELDIWADPDGGNYAHPVVRRLSNLPYPPGDLMNQPGTKVLHVADKDVGTTCYTLVSCLTVLRTWSRAHPHHVPIPIMLEFKTTRAHLGYLGGTAPVSWNDTALLDALDAELRAVFAPHELLTPDDLRRGGDDGLTLEESVLSRGWPDLDSARGRFFFVMDDGPQALGAVRNASVEGRPSLEGRVVFTQSAPGQPDCAFQKLNKPLGRQQQQNIREQVHRGYWVRTRADEPISTVLSDDVTAVRDAAFASGAQIVSTDWPAHGMSARYHVDYVVQLDGGMKARCNPVNAPDSCKEGRDLEAQTH